jgi:hypothetical protein
MKFFTCYHEGRQIGSVNGKEHHGEHGPHIGHKSGSKKKGIVGNIILTSQRGKPVCFLEINEAVITFSNKYPLHKTTYLFIIFSSKTRTFSLQSATHEILTFTVIIIQEQINNEGNCNPFFSSNMQQLIFFQSLACTTSYKLPKLSHRNDSFLILDSSLVDQEIPQILWNLKFHYSVHKFLRWILSSIH